MSKTNLPATFLDNATLNVNVGIDEVVSVFVTKYEDKLFAQKDDLSRRIKATKQALADLDKSLIASVDTKPYNVSVPELGFTFKAKDVSVSWEESYRGEKNSLQIQLVMLDKQESRDEREVFHKHIYVKIPAARVKEKQELDQDIDRLNGELMEVMSNIKAVSRKERQIRGRISEMKLEKAGHQDLLGNAELIKLIESK